MDAASTSLLEGQAMTADNPTPDPDLSISNSELLKWLKEISAKLDSIGVQLARLTGQTTAVRSKPSKEVLQATSTLELESMLSRARTAREYETILDIRGVLRTRLEESARDRLDKELASWFTRNFLLALRCGQAVAVAGSFERAVLELGPSPEMSLLADALPTVQQSVGLYLESRSDNFDHDDSE